MRNDFHKAAYSEKDAFKTCTATILWHGTGRTLTTSSVAICH